MDAYLTPDAKAALAAAAALHGAVPAGFLIGHVRGGRVIVEGWVQAPAASLADPAAFFRLDALDPGRIVGFLVPGSSPAARRPLLRPHACGRLVLTARPGRGGSLSLRAWIVDYDGRFAFKPAPVVTSSEETP